MKSLQASTSYGVGFAVSSFPPPPPPSRPSRRRTVVTVAKVEPSEKSVEVMRKFSEQYARRSETYFCMDKGVTSVVIKGLAEHRDTLGAPLCPCRHYDDKAAEAQQGFWNCPCVPMRERSATACFFSHLTMILLEVTRPFLWRRLKKEQQICDAFNFRRELSCELFPV